uniref:GTP-binding protein Parf n=1 Tax=Globisporangium ultimum (strain ATCC 200006 / CBS 805.95 / DAOM BR144) TaxID=431595 RepID=K3WS36_GLOUD
MGNEASRPVGDGLSPQGGILERVGSSPQMPPTPTFTPTAGAGRRSKSFTGFQSPSPSSATANVGGVAASPSSATSLQKQQSMPRVERTIQRMDKAIRRRVRGGITYNMKIIIRGEKGTGKTSLFQRLKGEPIPDEHMSTPQLQSATINWNFRTNSEENVKCEVWDVVDRGFNPLVEGSEAAANGPDSADHNGSPFELGALQANGGNFASVRASAAVAASIAGATGVNGAHTVATVDASTVDVYHETHGVVFLLDITKWHTLEYVKKELEKVPVHIPTLVLGNFRDCGNQRKIFKEDIQDLLYGSSDRSRQQQQGRRPHELLYFECSLLNCYGLKSLHQYFGVPFLQLKLATIRQQMRIVEGEFSHLKHDLTAKISEQRYSDYVEHIKATGSDIRTGRKVSGTAATGLVRMESTAIVVNGSEHNLRVENDDTQNAAAHAKLGRTQSNASTGSDIVVTEQSVASSNHVDAPNGTVSPSELSLSQSQQKDLEDLPERTNSLADQVTVPLKIAHAESAPVDPNPMEQEEEGPSVSKKTNKPVKSSSKNYMMSKETTAKDLNDFPVRTAQKVAVDEPMSLEDFQVPKLKKNDLDSFYSDEDSDVDGASDEDVIVPPAAGAMKKYTSHNHKQMFIDSDASDSDEEVKSRRKAKKSSPRKRKVVAQPVNEPSVTPTKSSSDKDAEAARDAKSVTDVEAEVVIPGKHTDDHPSIDESRPEHHQPQPPPSPSTTASSSIPVSPLQRTSRSPSPRQKLDSSRSNSPKLGHPPVLCTDDTAEARTRGERVEENNVVEDTSFIEGKAIVEKAVLVNNAPEGPSGSNSPRRHLPLKESSQSNSSRKNSFEAESVAEVSTEVAILTEMMSNGVLDEQTHEEAESTSEGVLSETIANEIKMSTDEAAVENEDKDKGLSSKISEELKYEEEAEHAVLSDGIEDFLSDKDGDKDDAVEVASSQVQSERPAACSIASMESEAKRPDLIVSDDEDDEPKLNGASAADEAGEDVHDLIVGSTMDSDKFFSDESDPEDEEKQGVEAQVSISIPSVTSVQSKTAQQNSRSSMLLSDEESEDDHAQIPTRNNPPAPVTAAPFNSQYGPDIAMNDESSDSDDERHVQKARATPVFSSQSNNKVKESSTPYVSAPAEAGFAPTTSTNELDSFFSESESESEDIRKAGNAQNLYPTPPSRAKPSNGPSRHSLVASDDDDDEDGSMIDRFASYNSKTVRKSKAERRQEREEIRRMTASLSSSTLIEDTTPAPTTLASIGNADVMAAIRQAQEEALRMMPVSDTASGGEEDKKRTLKSKSNSSSSSSHRRSSKTHGEHLAASSSSSSTTKKKKSSSKSSSRSKREAGSGNERRESRRR